MGNLTFAKRQRSIFELIIVFLSLVLLSGCLRKPGFNPQTADNRVVIYCSVDDIYARVVLKQLEAKTGLRIDALYDTEAAKTAGLAYRVRAERNRPQGDLFWNSGLLQTELLGREGLLQPYVSPAAASIPFQLKDPHGLWTGMGVRLRVLAFHRGSKPVPAGLQDLLRPELRNRIGISNPQFGSASDWVAALAVRWGKQRTLDYFRALQANGVANEPGNSVVTERIARGELTAGVTDSDDFLERAHRFDPIGMAAPVSTDASPQVLIPVSIAMLKGAPHAAAARKLIDAMLAPDTVKALSDNMPGVFSPWGLTGTGPWTSRGIDIAALRANFPDDTARWPEGWDAVNEPLASMLLPKG